MPSRAPDLMTELPGDRPEPQPPSFLSALHQAVLGGQMQRYPFPRNQTLTADPDSSQGLPVSVMYPLLNASRNNLCFLAEAKGKNSRSSIY